MCSRAELEGTLLAALIALAAGCTGGGTPAPELASDAVLVEDSAASDTGARFRLIAAAPAGEGFPHGRHRGLECRRCHDELPGHGTHAAMDCSACHAPVPVDPVAGEAAERDCASCHHAPAPQFGCAHCHEDLGSPPDRPVTVQARFSTSGLVVRRLPFRHAAHAPVECARCHGTAVSTRPVMACAGCHEDHHAATAACSGCHPAPAGGAHDARSHAGCGSAGCHDDPVVGRLPLTRPVCVSCHREQLAHEPGAECGSCHPVQPPAPSRPREASR